MNRIIIAAVCAVIGVCLITAGCNKKERDTDMTETVLAQFEALTQIPRPSHHEAMISTYLETWATDRGFDTTRDAYNNIVFEVPATKGYEKLPKVALQCHMDMVFAVKEGLTLDPLTTPITTVSDGTYLRSDGSTSLGADDGIGIALALCIADGKTAHGPLRVIITTDEEDSLSGTENLDPKYLTDIEYLINVDSETEGELCVSSAGFRKEVFSAEYEAAARTKEKAFRIDIKGLLGGHSGLDINKNHINGGILMGNVLHTIRDAGVDFELGTLEGGAADNVIIPSSSAVIYADETDAAAIKEAVDHLDTLYGLMDSTVDTEMEITVFEKTAASDTVLPAEETDAVLSFLMGLTNGIVSMSENIEGLVECSSNLGKITVSPTAFNARVMSRSSNEETQAALIEEHRAFADTLGYTFEQTASAAAWAYKPGSKLETAFRDAYRDLFGSEMKVIAIHAGLECGTYAAYNDDLNIVSVGPTIKNAHSVKETLEIATIDKVWDLLAAVLVRID